jgi:hypothetical protein
MFFDQQRLQCCGLILAMALTGFLGTAPALAQFPTPKADPNQRQVYLVRQDQSDCDNTNVPNVDSPLVSGNVWVTRQSDGNTNIRVAINAKPRTTYHFHLKCVRRLTEITTDDEGVGNASISVPTSQLDATFAFDMYPEGAPSGNKFQSATVKFN